MSSYIRIASQTLSSGQSSITFSSIPATLNGKTLRDLIMVCAVLPGGNDSPAFRINDNSSFSRVSMNGSGSTAASNSTADESFAFLSFPSFNVTTSDRYVARIEFLDAFATDKHKAVLSRMDAATVGTRASAHRVPTTSAISSITLWMNSAAGSTFSLYGIEG